MPEKPTEARYDIQEHTRAHVHHVIRCLADDVRPSVIATHLKSLGLANLLILYVFRQATGARLMDLKQFSQWWSQDGVTDAEQFDAYAKTVLDKL